MLCKILERIIVEHVTDHLIINELQSSEPNGFTKGKSTVTNLLEAMNIWTESLQHNIPIDIIFLDYAKAFDTVPHCRLIRQVQRFGIGGTLLKWLEDFLHGRRQKVQVNGAVSGWVPVCSGVPQGSVIGPMLFSLFVNDCPKLIDSIMSLFADDTKLYAALSLSLGETSSIQTDLDKLQDWANMMCMRFHPDKCRTMHMGSNNPQQDYSMKTDTGEVHILESTTEEKDLGVTIDNKLTFTTHVNQVVQKSNKVMGMLRRTFSHIDKEIFCQLYKSLVRPHLEYASVVWNPPTVQLRTKLEQVQRRATKMVPRLRDLTYERRLQELNLPTLAYRRRRADIIQMFKILKNLDHLQQDCRCTVCPGKNMFSIVHSVSTRGHPYKIRVQHAQGVRSKFFATRSIAVWNSLPGNIVCTNAVNELKTALKYYPHEKSLM